MAQFKILQENGVDIYPVTHPGAVRDEDGKSVVETIGDIAELRTTDKTSIVNAINEVVGTIGNINSILETI